jgi:hypothetical protein
MPITTIFTPIPNPLADAPSSRCNSTGTPNLDIPNEPSPISGHIAADYDRAFGHRSPSPAKPATRGRPAAIKNRYLQCLQSSRLTNSLATSIAKLTPDLRAPARLAPRTPKYQTNLVPFPETSPPIAAAFPQVSLPGASGLVFNPPNARHCSIDVRLTSGSV